jgi:hypothetical protein
MILFFAFIILIIRLGLKKIIYLAIGCVDTKATASAIENILSASESGISIQNSSSIAMTISTASRESKSKSSLNLAVADTLEALTFKKILYLCDKSYCF